METGKFSHDLEGTKNKAVGRLERAMLSKNSKREVSRNRGPVRTKRKKVGVGRAQELEVGRTFIEMFLRKMDMMTCMT